MTAKPARIGTRPRRSPRTLQVRHRKADAPRQRRGTRMQEASAAPQTAPGVCERWRCRGRGHDVERRLALRPGRQRRTTPRRDQPHLLSRWPSDVFAQDPRRGWARRSMILEALWPGFRSLRHVPGGTLHRVPFLKFDDRVVDVHPPLRTRIRTPLLLLRVRVWPTESESRGTAGSSGRISRVRAPRTARSAGRRRQTQSPMSARSSRCCTGVNATPAILWSLWKLAGAAPRTFRPEAPPRLRVA